VIVNEAESRLRAREMLIAIDGSVDRLMTRHGLTVPEDRVEALLARAEFLGQFKGARVVEWPLRSAYVHLHETLTDMSAEPIMLSPVYTRRISIFLDVIETI
jgi:hypothetical protein